MKLIKTDLRELDLNEADLWNIFWRAEILQGLESIKNSVHEQYMAVLNHCDEPQLRRVKQLISTIVVVGAVRGLQWGHELHRRQSNRRKVRDNGKHRKDYVVGKILACAPVYNLLQKPKVSVKEICELLDKRDLELPWKDLANNPQVKDSRFWATHAKNGKVKVTIGRAQKTAKQIAQDIKYIRAFMRGKEEGADTPA